MMILILLLVLLVLLMLSKSEVLMSFEITDGFRLTLATLSMTDLFACYSIIIPQSLVKHC